MITSISEGFHPFCKSARTACRQCQKKRMNVGTVTVLLQIYSRSLSVRSPVCPVNKNKVLIPIKLLVVYFENLNLHYYRSDLIWFHKTRSD